MHYAVCVKETVFRHQRKGAKAERQAIVAWLRRTAGGYLPRNRRFLDAAAWIEEGNTMVNEELRDLWNGLRKRSRGRSGRRLWRGCERGQGTAITNPQTGVIVVSRSPTP